MTDAYGLLVKLVNTASDNYHCCLCSFTVCPRLWERLSRTMSSKYMSLRLPSCFGNQATCVSKYVPEGSVIHLWLVCQVLPARLSACMAAGIRLLQKMGWRQGKGIGTADTRASGVGTSGGSRWGRVAGVGIENTPLYALKPKDTLHGLGFDPFKVQYSSNDADVAPAACNAICCCIEALLFVYAVWPKRLATNTMPTELNVNPIQFLCLLLQLSSVFLRWKDPTSSFQHCSLSSMSCARDKHRPWLSQRMAVAQGFSSLTCCSTSACSHWLRQQRRKTRAKEVMVCKSRLHALEGFSACSQALVSSP